MDEEFGATTEPALSDHQIAYNNAVGDISHFVAMFKFRPNLSVAANKQALHDAIRQLRYTHNGICIY